MLSFFAYVETVRTDSRPLNWHSSKLENPSKNVYILFDQCFYFCIISHVLIVFLTDFLLHQRITADKLNRASKQIYYI